MTGNILSLLLVDDEPAHLEAITRAFQSSGREVRIKTAGALGEYREALAECMPDIAILDLNLPDGRAVDILTAPPESGPFPIIIMTSYGDEQRAVEAMKAGALDYIVKSPEAFADMPGTVRRALREWELLQENKRAAADLKDAYASLDILWTIALSPEADLLTICGNALSAILQMTGSEYGFYGFVNENETVMDIHSWSGEAMRGCSILNKPDQYPIINSGVWAEAVRKRKVVIVNDYSLPHSAKKGLPAGHVPLTKLMVVPIFSKGRIVAVGALANRARDYDEHDSNKVRAFLNGIQSVIDRKKAEDALRSSEEKYRALVENSPNVVLRFDREGRHLYANPAVVKATGIPPEAFVGKTHREMGFPPELCDYWEEHISRVFETGKEVREIFSFEGPGGHITFDWRLEPEFAPDGSALTVLSVAHDITEIKRAEKALLKSESKMRAIFAAMNDVILILDSDGKYLEIAPTNPKFMYKPPADLLGKKLCEVFPVEQADFFLCHVREALAKRQLTHMDYTLVIENAEYWFSATLAPFTENSVILVARDVTERARMTEALRESEERYREIIKNMENGFAEHRLILDERGNPSDFVYLDINGAYERIIGSTRDQVIGKRESELTPTFREESFDWLGVYGKVAMEGTPVRFEAFSEFLGKWFSVSSYRSAPEHFVTNFYDITARKRAEETLRQSEERYREVFNNTNDGIFIVGVEPGPRFRLLDFNPAERRFVGLESTQNTGGYVEEVVGEELAGVVTANYRRCLEAGTAISYEEDLNLPDGRMSFFTTIIPVKDSAGNIYRLVGIAHDITKRKRAEESVKRREAMLDKIYDLLPIGLWFANSEGKIQRGNPAGVRIWGAEPKAEISGYGVFKARRLPSGEEIAPDDWALARTIREGVTIVDELLEIDAFDGKQKIILNYSAPVLDDNGQMLGAIVINQDITGRKLAEAALRESEQQLVQLVEQSPISIEIYTPDGLLVNANRAYEYLWGIPKEMVIGRYNILQHHHSRDLKIIDLFEKAFRGESVQIPLLEHDPNTYGGFSSSRKRTVQPYIYPIINDQGMVSHVILINIDVTEQKQLELQFRQVQKMETIGRLAGGVAHDFNNILTVINANAEMALMFLTPGEAHYDAFEEIRKAGERAANLTRQLLAFSRRQIIEPRVINLNQTLMDMDKMLRRLIGENIELVTIPDESLWPVNVDPGQVEQVLTNLVVNARDAMPKGGKLTIETRNTMLDEEYAKDHPGTSLGKYVMFTVSDNGIGMEEEVRAQIFEPFFTTKPKGSGTGLGLATCYGIVKQNDGNIWVYSEPGLGATIKVYLPAREDAAFFPGDNRNRAPMIGGTEMVLVVEDDSGIRKMVTRQLAAIGYRVLSAANGDEAVSQAYKFMEPIDLLITDVIMPLMGGKELADRMTKRYPGLRVLFMSGYTDNSIVHHGILEPGVKFIQKPFSMVDFAKKIREVIEE